MRGMPAACAGVVIALCASGLAAQQTGQPPRFEVASIRPCKDPVVSPGRKGGRGGGGGARGSPGSLIAECQTVENLIRWAYLGYPDGKPWPVDETLGLPVRPPDRVFRQEIKGPGWLSADHYTIEAKASGAASMEMMRGPMMQALLENRFHLRIRVEKRDTPVYFLTLAGSGPKLTPSKPGICISFAEFDRRFRDSPPEPSQTVPVVCGAWRPTIIGRNIKIDPALANRSVGIDTFGQTMKGLCAQFSAGADRDVIDRTGLAGAFDIHLELASNDVFPANPKPDDLGEPAAGPGEKTAHIAAAVQKVGLKLDPGKTPEPFVVILRVQRPTEN